MGLLNGGWDDDDAADYDGPMFGSGLSDHLEKKQIRKEIFNDTESYFNYDKITDVPDHLINEIFEKRQ